MNKDFNQAPPPLNDKELQRRVEAKSKDMPSLYKNNAPGKAREGRLPPGPAPISNEQIVQIGFKVPISLADAIEDMREERGFRFTKSMILHALKEQGLDVPDEQVNPPSRRKRY